jgi:hypothetical protein
MRFASAAIVLAMAGLVPAGAQEPPQGKARPERLRPRDLREIFADTPARHAVERGLDFLAKSQLPDGSWLSPLGKNTGVIGLAVLSMLSAGGEPGRGKHGDSIDRAVRFVLSHSKSGMLTTEDTSHGPMYEHGIATLLLGEVLGMVNEERPGYGSIYRVHRGAVDLILRAQNKRDRISLGGWRYTPDSTDADISVSGWQLLALRAAQDAGLPIPQKSIDQAVLFVKRCVHPSGGFTYMPGGGFEPGIARTGTGVLALQICGDFQSPEARRGGDWLSRNPLEWKGPFFYYSAYYGTQAMYQLGGEYWGKWHPPLQALLLSKQSADGSWPPPPGEALETQAGLAYSTALAILSLTVECRYLPIYQR